MKYIVLRDNREKQGWDFSVTEHCAGLQQVKLPTGDYSLLNFEHLFTIERKATTGEFAQNIVQQRFERELQRMQKFPHAFMILEFTMADVLAFPKDSGIPVKLWPKLRISPWFLLKRLTEFEVKYKTKIILAGSYGKEVASSIFKRVVELYGAANRQEGSSTKRIRKKTSKA